MSTEKKEHGKKLFAAIIDGKKITRDDNLLVTHAIEGDGCLVIYDNHDYRRTLSFLEVLRRADQFIIEG